MRILLLNSSAMAKALGPGERWITVHPNGKDATGQAVLVQPQKDGSMKVIGGAGGNLNHLKLTGVKPQTEYSETLKERASERRDRKKRQKARDKEMGLSQAKAEAHRKVSEQTRAAQNEYVEAVGNAMGWDPATYTFDPEAHAGKPEHVLTQLYAAHTREMVKRADAAVRLNRQRIMADASARAEADFGEVPLASEDPNQLSVQDIDPVRIESVGLGFSTDYRHRAEDAGADVAKEAEEFRPAMTDGQRKAAIKNGETAQMVADGLKVLREPETQQALAPKLVEAKEALGLMKLEKKRKMAERQARAARKDIDAAVEEPKAYVLEIDDAQVDAKVAEEVANDLRTISTRAFLNEVADTVDDVAKIRRHVSGGAYNSINALALAAGGAGLVDRSVVDVLGVAGAADVLARRLSADLSADEFKMVADGVQEYHLHHYVEASEEAIGRARELQAQAHEIELGAAENGGDLVAMQEINRRRGDAIREAQKTLGTALGEMEANAALVMAMKGGASSKPFQVAMGEMSMESAISQVRAIGLQRGDYKVETIGGNRVLTVTPEGMGRLAQPVNREHLDQVRRNLDIMTGGQDEDGWLPLGIADRPDLDSHPKPGSAPSMAIPFEPGADLEASVADYIGGRAADGDLPADIVSDLQSGPFFAKVGERGAAYRSAIDKLAPLTDADGALRPADALRPDFEALADKFVAARGGDRKPLHRQTFDVDDTAIESLHRALAAEPTGVTAFKPVGELTPQDQAALREHFAKHVAKESPEATALRGDLERHEGAEPEREMEDMFGEKTTNPEWSDWRSRRDEMRGKVSAGSTSWPKYVEAMRGPERAYAAMQDVVRSGVTKAFAEAHNTLKPGKPLKIGRTTISDNLNHLDAVDPDAREARMAKERGLVDTLRNRVGGRYAGGAVSDKLDAARSEEAGLDAAQMSFFSADEIAPESTELAADERHTIGLEAERQIAGMMPQVGANFKPGQPVKLYRPTMSGGKNWARQRAVKLLEANKRVTLSFGTGAGKTLIGLAGYSHLASQGKAKRGLFLVPSIAQGNFGADALRFLQPGKFKGHVKPGASRAERIAAYKDPSNHFAVMTHQAFRDDMVHLGAQHAGVDEAGMSAQLAAMAPEVRADWLKGVMDREGIDFDYLNVDEGHDTLNRQGKENSTLANVVDALGDKAPYYINASADPVKNDVSEAFSLLQKMAPTEYTDRAAFMRKYGNDALSAKDGLRRELARFQYPSKIDPDITANRIEQKVPLAPAQHQALADLDANLAKARVARMGGKIDMDAVKALSPSSFEGVSQEDEGAVATALTKNLGLIKQTAIRRILDGHAEGGKAQAVSDIAAARRDKPGVVFAHSLDTVKALQERLAADGFRVIGITGADSAKEKAAKVRKFNPQAGEREADIIVASDAGAVGAEMQSGRWLVNYDTPDTAKTHAQRNGRINRTGQTGDVDLIDLVNEHPEEQKRRDRLSRKYGLRELMTTPMESLDDTGVAYYLKRRDVAAENGGLL